MIVFPRTVDEVLAASGELRAGATELHERRNQGLAPGPLVDLRDVAGLSGIAWAGAGATVGARTTIAAIASDAELQRRYPGLTAAAGALATPQIRAVATIAGNLIQRTRCWYFRSPEANCLKKGGDRCHARSGDHLLHACFDLGPCVAVHPSTLAMALMAYDAEVTLAGASPRTLSIAALMGDGADPRREHALPTGALITGVRLPAPLPAERAAYVRTIARARAEWPLVEAVVRVALGADGRITTARVAIGGVAPVPLRRTAVEDALLGALPTAEVLDDAAKLSVGDAKPLPMTEYKVALVVGTVLEALERAVAATPSPEAAPAPDAEPQVGADRVEPEARP